MRSPLLAPLPLALVLAARAAAAAPGAGTIDDPVRVDAFPYAARGTTAGAASDVIDLYDCATGIPQSGPEVVHELTLDAPARVTAWVEGDGGGVDIDVHLLDGLAFSGATAETCASRGNTIAEAELQAGTHYVVVDTYAGDAQAGAFVLHVEAIGDAWIERPAGEGVRWRSRRFADLAGGPQVVNELLIDAGAPGVRVEARRADGCQTIGALGAAEGAVAAINGGFYGGPDCGPVSLLKSGGALIATNDITRGAFGLSVDQAPRIALVAAGQDWPDAAEAHGGGPILLEGGAPRSGAGTWAAEGFVDDAFVGPNPRTFAAIDSEGRIHLATVDGRRDSAAGMSLDALAAFAASSEIGAAEAVNLGGGGITALWVKGATPNGIVSYPSDDPDQEQPEHAGSRPVSGGFLIYAPPYNHPPRFQTAPIEQVSAGAHYAYDADAIDLDVDDVVSFSLKEGPAGMRIDPATGVVSYDATIDSPASAAVTIVASDDRGAATEQAFALSVAGGMGDGGPGPGPGAGAGEDGAGEDGGCGCRAAPAGGAAGGAALLAAAALAAARRARRQPTRLAAARSASPPSGLRASRSATRR